MTVLEFFEKCLDDNYKSLLIAADGLTQEELSWQPQPHCNSIGFLVWHYGRALDMWFQTHFRQIPELWEQGWAEKFNRAPADPMDIGFRFTVEQVQEFKVPHISILLGYAEATYKAALSYLKDVADQDPDTIKNHRGTRTLATALEQLVWELNQHGGQIAYIRGLRRGVEDANFAGPALAANKTPA